MSEQKAVYIESPSDVKINPDKKSIFLAGTISGAPNWQKQMADALSDLDITVINPRRPGDIMKDNDVAMQQIKWEFDRLKQVDVISFYFSPETLNPITLFELGRHTYGRRKPIFVGVHPEYARKFDVEVQMHLVGIQPVYSLEHLISEVYLFMNKKKCGYCGGSGSKDANGAYYTCSHCDGSGQEKEISLPPRDSHHP